MNVAKLIALCELSARWHGGQWSRLYRIGCRAHTALRKIGITHPLDVLRAPYCRKEFKRETMREYRKYFQMAKNDGEI